MINRLILLAACALFATTGMASAAPHYTAAPAYGVAQPDKSSMKVVGGIVNGSGGIVYGSGFSVSHPATGEYEIKISPDKFTKCPVINITPAGGAASPPLANLYYYGCSGSGITMTIFIVGSTNGDLEDNSFHFSAVQP